MAVIFPEIFITAKLPQGWTRESLIADGLCAWANCMCGNKPPENFGKGMALIYEQVGAATPDELLLLANKKIKKK